MHVSLSLSRKFLLLGLLGALLFLIPFSLYVEQVWREVREAREEQAGIAPITRLLQVVRLTQQHRGLTNGGLTEQRMAKRAEADSAYGDLTNAASAYPAGAIREAWDQVLGEWRVLSEGIAAGSIRQAESFSRHTALIRRQLDLVVLMAEHHGLTFEADPAAHHLVYASLVELPQLTESLGQMRARGTAYLAQRTADPLLQAPVAALTQTARLQSAAAETSLRKAQAANTSLGTALNTHVTSGMSRAEQGLALVEKEVLASGAPVMEPAAYFKAITEHIDALFLLQDQATAELQKLFHQRIQREAWAFTGVTAAILASALVVLGFALLIVRSITRPVREAVLLAQRVADGDLTVELQVHGRDEIGQLQQALSDMVGKLRTMLANVAGGARVVADTSAQIAQGNVDLSQRTEEQASTLEETASSMEEITSTVSQNAESARVASGLAVQALTVAREGGSVVGEVVRTMEEISGSSRRIGEISGLIDSIAFQTNILALNAAVEAARAGEQGRGFAVVASEVRTLAQRSAGAAREIKALIGESAEKVQSGVQLVQSAGATMREIVAAVDQVQGLISEIAAASREQTAGIEQVGTAVMQMDQVVQHNASLVEESAAAAESLKHESAQLLGMVAHFKLRADVAAAEPRRVAQPRRIADEAYGYSRPLDPLAA